MPAAGQPHPHAVTAVGSDAYGYDASGNTVARPGQSLTWDEAGKLSTVTTSAGQQSRVYDADGKVLLQTDPTAGAKLFLDETELTTAPGGTAASGVRTYTIAGAVVAERTTQAGVSGTKLTWLSGDINGTQDLSLDQAVGSITRRFADPYGNPRGANANWGSEHGYLNASISAFTTLTQLGARAYDALLGRFISVDPVLAPDNPSQNNGYSYSANNPVTFSDPDGRCYVAGKDALSFKRNCGGGTGISAPQAPGATTYPPQSGSYAAKAIAAKGDARQVTPEWVFRLMNAVNQI